MGVVNIKRNYSEYEINKILQQPYISSTVLAEELNIPASTIRRYRNKVNGSIIRKPFNPDKNEFIKKYNELKTCAKMAEYYDTNKAAIKKYAHKIGYDTLYKPKITDEQKQEIISMYNIISAEKLSKRYGISGSYVSQIWMNAGLSGKQNRVYSIDENYFSVIDKPEKAYFLGFIGSDGCLCHPETEKQDVIRICIRYEDVKVLELFRSALKTDKPIIIDRDVYRAFEISSNKISHDIQNLGITYRKTWGNAIAEVDRLLIPHLLRGYMDGDGSISPCANSDTDINISISGFEINMRKIQEYLTSKFIYTSFTIDKRKNIANPETGPFGQLTISNRTAKYCFLKLIYNDCGDYYMDRKYNAAMKFINYIEHSEKIRDKQIVLYYKYAVCATS